jgi:hypothetical protein
MSTASYTNYFLSACPKHTSQQDVIKELNLRPSLKTINLILQPHEKTVNLFLLSIFLSFNVVEKSNNSSTYTFCSDVFSLICSEYLISYLPSSYMNTIPAVFIFSLSLLKTNWSKSETDQDNCHKNPCLHTGHSGLILHLIRH